MTSIDYIVIAVYFLLLIAVGVAFSRLSRSASDYIRGGGKGTWWLVGMSALLGSISAFTFTGNASGAFQGGYSLIVIYLANFVGSMLHAAGLAARFRQTRAFTGQDILRERFGPEVEQFSCYLSLIKDPMMSGVALYAVSIFCSSVFGLDERLTIVALGGVVTLYATKGGKWSVLGNDFVQSLILFPITILVAVLSLQAVGGIGGFIGLFSRPDLARDFAFIKPAGQFAEDRFTLSWMATVFVLQLVNGYVSFGAAGRYLSVRSGKDASRAALVWSAGMLLGACVWFIPPIVARGLWATEVNAMPVAAGTGAYAYAAMKVLPQGMIGIMVVAMFAATLSGMDTGLNTLAGTVMHNLVPALRRKAGRKPLSEPRSIAVGKAATVVLGLLNIGIALLYAGMKNFSLFDAFNVITSIIGLPVTLPLVAGLFLRKLPRSSFFIIAVAAAVPSLWSLIDAQWFHFQPWTYVNRTFWVLVGGAVGTLVSLPLHARSTAEFRTRVDAFFARMNRPLSPDEIGEGTDHLQATILGRASLVLGGFVLLLTLMPNPAWGRAAIAAVALSVMAVGGLLLAAARAHRRRLTSVQSRVTPPRLVESCTEVS